MAQKIKYAVQTPQGKFKYFIIAKRAVAYLKRIGGNVVYKVNPDGYIKESITVRTNPGWIKARAIRVTRNGTVQVKR